jgi:hypothetical protein
MSVCGRFSLLELVEVLRFFFFSPIHFKKMAEAKKDKKKEEKRPRGDDDDDEDDLKKPRATLSSQDRQLPQKVTFTALEVSVDRPSRKSVTRTL